MVNAGADATRTFATAWPLHRRKHRWTNMEWPPLPADGSAVLTRLVHFPNDLQALLGINFNLRERAKDRMARDADALDADREGKRTTRGRIQRGGDEEKEGVHWGRTGRRRTSRATNQAFWTNYEWYIRCARLIYAYLPSVPPSPRLRHCSFGKSDRTLHTNASMLGSSRALKNHTSE